MFEGAAGPGGGTDEDYRHGSDAGQRAEGSSHGRSPVMGSISRPPWKPAPDGLMGILGAERGYGQGSGGAPGREKG